MFWLHGKQQEMMDMRRGANDCSTTVDKQLSENDNENEKRTRRRRGKEEIEEEEEGVRGQGRTQGRREGGMTDYSHSGTCVESLDHRRSWTLWKMP